jgi:hypothetical protein
VNVSSRAGSAEGVLVTFARFASGSSVGLLESWPDGARHAYAGTAIKPSDIEVWPAARVQ